ncbi:TRAP-type uncharacterized transport system [Candidatus Terasakiella magnetica]|nr:TRAP-type uncharacterized transport system [Candidatus Terasakiella magnetica]
MRNRTRILLLAFSTLALTLVAVSTAGYWYTRPTVVTIAVGPEGSAEHRFARNLAEILVQNRSSIQLAITAYENNSQALSHIARPGHDADLAILRTDERRVPPSARALAVLEHEAVLVIGAKRSKLATLADLQGKRVVVVGRDGRNEAFLRRMLESYKVDMGRTSIRTVAPETPLTSLLPTATDLVVVLEPLSRLGAAGDFEGLAHSMHGFAVHAIEDAKALERKVPGLYAETIEAGLLSGSPRIPDTDMETVALQKILVARAKLPESQVVELMRALFESGRQLGVEKTFAVHIEPPDTEKGALIAAHEGANQFVDHEVKTFFDRYSDLMYVAISAGSVFASAAIALYGTVFRRRPRQATERVGELMALRERARTAATLADLEGIEADLGLMLDDILRGLDDGSMSPRGLEAFRLAFDHARDVLTLARARVTPGR